MNVDLGEMGEGPPKFELGGRHMFTFPQYLGNALYGLHTL